MPETPGLEVNQEVLKHPAQGQQVVAAQTLRLTVLSFPADELGQGILGRKFVGFSRQGNFLLAELWSERLLLVNPMPPDSSSTTMERSGYRNESAWPCA